MPSPTTKLHGQRQMIGDSVWRASAFSREPCPSDINVSVPQAIREAYDRAQPIVKSVATIVEPTIAQWCRDRTYLFRGRIKTVESTGEKLEGGRYASWTAIDDLYACMIVVPDRNHVGKVLAYLETTFLVQAVRG